MKRIITLIGIVTAVVFINPAQAKADVRAYVYFNPLSWFFTPPVKVIKKRPVYHRPVRKRVVYVKPNKYKRVKPIYKQPRKYVKNKYNYNKRKYKNRHYKKNRGW